VPVLSQQGIADKPRRPRAEEERAQARQQASFDTTTRAQPSSSEVWFTAGVDAACTDSPRTHRERKELYIKALEQEVLRLKESFTSTSRERDAFAEENRRLKELLLAHGISFDMTGSLNGLPQMGSSTYGSSNGSVSGYGPGSSSTGYTSPQSVQHQRSISQDGMMQPQLMQQSQPILQHSNGLDYDSIGVDFVLTYDRSPYLSPPPQQ
jgi:hypothetical protein